jgi:hypothetical protein
MKGKMSMKTIKQRIAVVAVSALTAGVLSVMSAPVANAAFGGGTSAGYLLIGTTAATDGVASTSSGAVQDSVGWVADTSSTAASTVALGVYTSGGNAKTGTVLAGAKLAVSASNSSSANVSIQVTGGTLGTLTATSSDATLALSGAQTTATMVLTPSSNETLAGIFTVTAAAGSTATITAYSGTSVTATAPTNGTLLGSWTLTVAAASVSGVLSVADSYVTQQACITKGATAVTDVATYDTSAKCQNGKVAVIYTSLYDALGSSVNGGTLAASATGGTVNVIAQASEDTITAADSYAATTAFDTIAASAENFILITQPTSNTAGSATVTITYNGTIVATKTVSWVGDFTTLVVDPASSHKTFANNKDESSSGFRGNIVYVAKDAAGNVVDLSSQPAISDATGALVEASIGTTTNVLAAALQTTSRGYGYATMVIPSNTSLYGKASYRLKATNAAGTVVKSQVNEVTVSNGATASFTASWDKASYVPGEIATLTITVKDAYGNLMGTGTTLDGLTDNLITNSTGFDAVGGSCTSSSTVTDGVKTCKFSADNTEGAYAWSVDLTTSPSNQSAVTGTANVKAATATVSNADVLKSIVALIASINKQIQALQKLILKR